MKPEVITLIIGAFLGAALTFIASRLEKTLEHGRNKNKANMCLKIELRRIDSYITALLRTQSTLGPSIPNTDIPELDMAVQASQFMYFDESLASKVYHLAKCLKSANKHRQIASPLLREQSNPNFLASADIFVHELKDSKRILKEINERVHFEIDN